MNQLQRNSDTGFLESDNSLVSFSSSKKSELIKLALDYIDKKGEMPTQTSLCKSVGISLYTLERHLKIDESFRTAYREILLHAREILTDVMFKRGLEPGGFMDRIALLRSWFPETYNPTMVHQSSNTGESVNKYSSKVVKYIDAETIPDNKPSV
jgi:hypothetical protein